MSFHLILGLVSLIAGSVASIVGFGIGSLLTPLVALQLGTKTAVAAVSVPHVIGTALRFRLVRRNVDRRTLIHFGLASAIGGLSGALLHASLRSRWLTLSFGVVLVLTGVFELTGVLKRLRFGRVVSWLGGALSGALGGLVGNQGGIRSAALLTFGLERDAFIATATAIGLIVDGVRMPVYLATQGSDLAGMPYPLAIMVAGVAVGTIFGKRLLGRIPGALFRRLVAAIVLLLGVCMLATAGR